MPEPARLKAKICLVGEGMVGKTSLIRRYVFDEFDDKYIITLGAKVSRKEIAVDVDDVAVEAKLTIWDFMGQEGFREMFQDAYFTGAGGILAVCDLTRRSTLDALVRWIESVRKVAGEVPTVLAANKADLDPQRGCRDADLDRFSADHRCTYVRTSAKTGANVEEAFRRLAIAVARRGIAEA